jgi:transcriptional regulator with XRE-family HTH domain
MTAQSWIPADTFGTRLFVARKQRRLTVEQAAKLCGVAQPTWTSWENGAHPRDLVAAVRRISEALDCDRDWLMWGGPLAAVGAASDPDEGVNKRAFFSLPPGVSRERVAA